MATHAEKKIEGTEEAWDDRLLGADEEFVAVSREDEHEINEELGLKMISIRLEQSLIEDFKAIATINGLGYQTLMRQALKRFAESEKKLIVRELASQMAAEAKAAVKNAKQPVQNRQKKAA